MSIEAVLLIVILTFGFGALLNRWDMRLEPARSRIKKTAQFAGPLNRRHLFGEGRCRFISPFSARAGFSFGGPRNGFRTKHN
jgi:hypothetical protein